MVQGIGKHGAVGQQPRQGCERRLVGGIARIEEQRRRLAMPLGKLALKQHVIVVGAGNVSRAAGPGARACDGLLHGLQHHRMLAHAEIVVGAPDDDFLGPAAFRSRTMAQGPGEAARRSFEIGEDAIAPLGLEAADHIAEMLLVVHYQVLEGAGQVNSLGRALPMRHAVAARYRRWLAGARDYAAVANPCSLTQAKVSSSALPKRRKSSWMSSSVDTSGGQKATESGIARTMSPCSRARFTQ